MVIDADILMITYNRPQYTRKSLTRLLETCPPCSRIWLWQNGRDEETLKIVKSFESHTRIANVRYSPDNQMLRPPTNWFWQNAKGRFIGKVDDDCIVPEGWVEALVRIHNDESKAGIISCWPYLEEDYNEEISKKKILVLNGGHKLLHNAWVGGSGYISKKTAIDTLGPLKANESFTQWCIRLARKGWLNGWPIPLLLMDHMDNPSSHNTIIRSEKDFQDNKPLTARRFDIKNYDDYRKKARNSALQVQLAKPDPWRYLGLTGKIVRAVEKLRGRMPRALFDP